MKGCKTMARFTNQAQLRYGNAVANSNIAVGEILEVLSATKTAVRTVYRQNDHVVYMISIVNSGNTAYTGLSVSDDLGEYLFGTTPLIPLTYKGQTLRYYVNGVLQTTPTVNAGPPLVISGISIPAGGNVMLVYETDVNSYAPLETSSEIINTATISGGGITPITIRETVTAESAPLLTITKSVSPVPVTENGTLTYTFLIQNSGSSEAAADAAVLVTDTFDPVLSNLTVSFNGTAWTEKTDYTYDETTGVFASEPGRITVPAASYTQEEQTGVWVVNPGVSMLVITGTI